MASRPCNHLQRQCIVWRHGRARHVYWTCTTCGEQWTDTDEVVDLVDVVTADEIIEVHEQLAHNDIRDLIGESWR